MQKSKHVLAGFLLGACLVPAAALAQPDVRARVHVNSASHPRAALRVDRFHRVPPDMRGRGLGVRVTPFHAHLGWRVTRFGPRERAVWTHGRWWHGRHNGRFGWWWWAGGGWYFYNAPVYPYPDYVSEYEYEEPGADAGDSWYYCRDPEGYYPYVKRCYGSWEPVPAQPDSGYDGQDYGGANDAGYGEGPGPGEDEMGSDEYGPPDQGPMDGEGPPDDQGPPDQGPPPR